MCGRFSQSTDPDDLAALFAAIPTAAVLALPPRYNVCPSQPVMAVRERRPGEREIAALSWGLVPRWARSQTGPRPINARAETAHEKPMFREALRHRRCLVPVEGFYEWRAQKGGRQPFFIRGQGERPLALAGLREHWEGDGETIESLTVLVTDANPLLAGIHDRMPVVIPPTAWGLWLDPRVTDPAAVRPLLVPYPAEAMRLHPVSRAVNSPANEGPELVAPWNEPGTLPGL